MKTGRPTKLTPKLTRAIAADLRAGSFAVTACARHGVDESSFYRWLRRAEQGEPLYESFASHIKKAEVEAEQAALKAVLSCGDRWRAAAWFLERRFPRRWGSQRQYSIAQNDFEGWAA